MTTYTGTNTTLLAYEATADAAADLTNTQQDYFMAKYLNTREIAETGQIKPFSDANGLVITPDDYENIYLEMLKSSATIVQQAK